MPLSKKGGGANPTKTVDPVPVLLPRLLLSVTTTTKNPHKCPHPTGNLSPSRLWRNPIAPSGHPSLRILRLFCESQVLWKDIKCLLGTCEFPGEGNTAVNTTDETPAFLEFALSWEGTETMGELQGGVNGSGVWRKSRSGRWGTEQVIKTERNKVKSNR